MVESVQNQISILESTVNSLQQAIPLIVTPSRIGEGLQLVNQAADNMSQLAFDPDLGQLSTSLKILSNGDSHIISTVSYQAFILDILEMLASAHELLKSSGTPPQTDTIKLLHVSEYLIRLTGRVTIRFKINVEFEPEYEAKSLRAFMVLKELGSVVRFLNITPDISENQSANLDGGFEIDCLSQEDPNKLHEIVGSVLEVQKVQIFWETKPQKVAMLDPPDHANSFDRKISQYLEG